MRSTVSPSSRVAVVLALALGLSAGTAACGDSDAADAPAAATSTTAQTGGSFATVGVAEFRTLLDTDDTVQLIDVRTPEEFAAGHIAGATNIDFQSPDFADRIEQLDRTERYAIYCRSGNRSGQALQVMRNAGFTDVTNLDGGTNDWTEAGLPLE